MTIATIFAGYFTMFIMTYLGLYVYHRIKGAKDYRYHNHSNMLAKRREMSIQSAFWPLTLIVSIFFGVVNGGSYIGNNFFSMLDTIGDKFFDTLPIKKNEDY